MLRSPQSVPAVGSGVEAEFLFLYRNHVHKNNSPRSGRASLLRNYLDVLMGAGDGNLELAFCSSPDLERSSSWPSYAKDQPPLKLVTSGAGWCNLVAREVSPPHLRTLGQESMLSQCSVSEMRVSAAPSVRRPHTMIHVSGHTDNWHVPSAQTWRYTRDESAYARTIFNTEVVLLWRDCEGESVSDLCCVVWRHPIVVAFL